MHLKEVDANLLVILDALLVDASVTRAAERLGRSASAISHALAKLREIFADELFVRAGQRLVPTAKAQELAPTVHVILAGMESLLRPAKPFDPRDAERDFAMTASEVGDLILVQPLRRRLEALAPSVRVGWMPGQGEETIEALRQGRCHFAIDIEAMELPAPDIRVLKLYDDRLACVARSGHPMSERKPDARSFAASDHIAVSALPTIELLDRELAKQRAHLLHLGAGSIGACRAVAHAQQRCAAHASSLARVDPGEAVFACPREAADRSRLLPGASPLAFELRSGRMPQLGAR